MKKDYNAFDCAFDILRAFDKSVEKLLASEYYNIAEDDKEILFAKSRDIFGKGLKKTIDLIIVEKKKKQGKQKVKMGWISTKDRLPEVGVRVLASYTNKYITINQMHIQDDASFARNVIYWMPLSEPPESEGERWTEKSLIY